MMRPKGFTLVELLVVIVIVAMLAGLLLPAVTRSRESARRAQCLNNQRQLAQAMQQYENARGQLPGYVNRFGGVSNLSWVVMLLQYVGEQELWKQWRDPNTAYGNKPVPSLPVVKCPSNTTITDVGLSFVVNCGRADFPTSPGPSPAQLRAAGLFFDHTVTSPIVVRTEALPDGADSTIMMSENLQATTWAPRLDAATSRWYAPEWAHVGMAWVVNLSSSGCWRINQCREVEQYWEGPRGDLARPSSAHPGGVNVTFASGRQQFLNEDIDYPTFCRLMVPDDKNALP